MKKLITIAFVSLLLILLIWQFLLYKNPPEPKKIGRVCPYGTIGIYKISGSVYTEDKSAHGETYSVSNCQPFLSSVFKKLKL